MTKEEDPVVLTLACAIAQTTGIEFDEAPKNKQEWTAKRGMFGGRFRDVNEPMQDDFLDMAEAALKALALIKLKLMEREPVLAGMETTVPGGEEAMTTPLSDEQLNELDDAHWHRHSLAKANVEIAKLRGLLRECDLWLGDADYCEDCDLVDLREKIHDALEGCSPPSPSPQPAECKEPELTIHKSDCAMHNAPAYPPGPCDCQSGNHDHPAQRQAVR